MNKIQRETIKEYFNCIRVANINQGHAYGRYAMMYDSELFGYIRALFQVGVIDDKVFEKISRISNHLAIYGTCKE